MIKYRLEGVEDSEPLYRLATTILDYERASATELAALREILDELVISSRSRRNQRGVKRKMSNFRIRRGYKGSPLIDICATIMIVK